MICFSSKREFSSFKFMINVQPLMFRQTTFIRSLKKVCKVLVLLQNWIASKSAQFFVFNSQTFFSKQQTPATKKMMVQYFAVCCQHRVLLQFHQNHCILKEQEREKGTAFSSSFQPHFQHYNRPYYFTFKSLFLILESSNQDYRRSKQPSSKINEFFMI